MFWGNWNKKAITYKVLVLINNSDCWTQETHEEIEEFTRGQLWRLVSKHTKISMASDVIKNIELLSDDDLRHLATVHFLMSDMLIDFLLVNVPSILNKLKKSSLQYSEINKERIRGKVNWPKTFIQRFIEGHRQDVFVTERKDSEFDLPENRLLKYVLINLQEISSKKQYKVQSEYPMDKEEIGEPTWALRISHILLHSRKFLKNIYLQQCGKTHYFSEVQIHKISRARNVHYKKLSEIAEQLATIAKDPAKYLLNNLNEKVLMPLDKNILFELAILFSVLRSAEFQGWQESQSGLIGGNKLAVSSFEKDGKKLSVYYQNGPFTFTNAGQYVSYIKKYKLSNRGRRPDILLEITNTNGKTTFIIVEVKRSKRKEYIVDGFYKVLGYLKDYEALEHNEDSNLKALLVCWSGAEAIEFESETEINISNWSEFPNQMTSLLSHYN